LYVFCRELFIVVLLFAASVYELFLCSGPVTYAGFNTGGCQKWLGL